MFDGESAGNAVTRRATGSAAGSQLKAGCNLPVDGWQLLLPHTFPHDYRTGEDHETSSTKTEFDAGRRLAAQDRNSEQTDSKVRIKGWTRKKTAAGVAPGRHTQD
jgi:hypothetical protein